MPVAKVDLCPFPRLLHARVEADEVPTRFLSSAMSWMWTICGCEERIRMLNTKGESERYQERTGGCSRYEEVATRGGIGESVG